MAEKAINILVVDDEESIRTTLKQILTGEGHTVSDAANGMEAVHLVRQNRFDILLVDYTLPDMNGLGLLKQVVHFTSDFIPIIITGSNSLEIAVEGMRLGVYAYLVKPIDRGRLVEAAVRALHAQGGRLPSGDIPASPGI